MTDYGSRKFIVTLLGLLIVVCGGAFRWPIDETTVGLIVLGYNGANAVVKATAQTQAKRVAKPK